MSLWQEVFLKQEIKKHSETFTLNQGYIKIKNICSVKELVREGKDRPQTLTDLTKGDTQTANKHMKRCSTLYIIRETQRKTAARSHYTPIKMSENPR